MSDCQKPGCRKSSSDTYTDEHGNELELCSKHYYELVSGETIRENNLTTSTGLGIGTDLDLFNEPETRGVDDILERDDDMPSGTTPCPNCGKPMPMVTWTGSKPLCRDCSGATAIEPTPWMGVLDPNTGETLGPTVNEYTDTTQNDVKIPEPQTL